LLAFVGAFDDDQARHGCTRLERDKNTNSLP
jgi:hypothetical protein